MNPIGFHTHYFSLLHGRTTPTKHHEARPLSSTGCFLATLPLRRMGEVSSRIRSVSSLSAPATSSDFRVSAICYQRHCPPHEAWHGNWIGSVAVIVLAIPRAAVQYILSSYFSDTISLVSQCDRATFSQYDCRPGSTGFPSLVPSPPLDAPRPIGHFVSRGNRSWRQCELRGYATANSTNN
ncbi:hypothetical protein BGX38DRAFT_236750 [Terfezia claveryi]|nr:hypothetical protein BGX38DRAFT_236750 [Terfezia claveryi]